MEQATINALYTAQLCGSAAPVYQGASRPLVRLPEHAQWFHGMDGMGDMNYPAPTKQAQPGHAVDALIETIRAYPGIVLVTLGPLTNVALAVSRAPEIVTNVSRCVVMGGAANTVGNVTPAAEYNIWHDPEAARIVFLSGLPIEMVGWELARGAANLMPDEMEMVLNFGTELGRFAIECNRHALQANANQSGDLGLALCDPVAMAVALDPAVCTRGSRHYVEIETHSELTRGMTVVDQFGLTNDARNIGVWGQLHRLPQPNARVCWEIDVRRWKQMLYQCLR